MHKTSFMMIIVGDQIDTSHGSYKHETVMAYLFHRRFSSCWFALYISSHSGYVTMILVVASRAPLATDQVCMT